MRFTYSSMLLILSFIFSASKLAQGLTQNQTCENACTVAFACSYQCELGRSYDPTADTHAYTDCLCQSGCLCNARICLQCCEAAGNDLTDCGSGQLGASNVLGFCGPEGSTAKVTPAKECFVYGKDSNGDPTSTYASNSSFPSSVETFISGLLPLTNVTIAASSLITGKAGAIPTPSPMTGVAGIMSALAQTTAKAGTTSVLSQTTMESDTTTVPSQTIGKAATTSTSPSVTSRPLSTTAPPVASPQKSAAAGTWPMAAKGLILLFALPFGFLFF